MRLEYDPASFFGGFRPISQGDLVSFRECTKKLGVATWIFVEFYRGKTTCLKQPNLKENMRQSNFGFHFPRGKCKNKRNKSCQLETKPPPPPFLTQISFPPQKKNMKKKGTNQSSDLMKGTKFSRDMHRPKVGGFFHIILPWSKSTKTYQQKHKCKLLFEVGGFSPTQFEE